MKTIPAFLAFTVAITAGVVLCLHDYPVLGGWVVILSLLGTWGFEYVNKE